MAKIGDYVKADEVVCPKCGAKLQYAVHMDGTMMHELTDEGIKQLGGMVDLDWEDMWFECPTEPLEHEVPHWLYDIDSNGKYIRFQSEEAHWEWDYEPLDQGDDDEAQG